MTSTQILLGSGSEYDELDATVEEMEQRLADRIAAARASANDDGDSQKSFIVPLLGDYPVLDPDDIFARFALQTPIVQIANAYLGMYTRLRYYNVWHTLVTQSGARQSQLWHHDREDRYILKIFVYLCDVDEGAGPFTYAAGTHLKGKMRRQPRWFLEGGVQRSDDLQMAEAASPEHWVKCVGPKGTIVLADTRGYHKGGLARERDRLMYTCMFTSPASESEEFLKRSTRIPAQSDKARAYALSGPRRLGLAQWRDRFWHPHSSLK